MDGVSRDRTPERDALREREALFREMADNAPVLLWRSGTDARRDFFNRPWLEFRGRSTGEEAGSGWFEDGVHPQDKARFQKACSEAFEARAGFEVEYRLRRHDGEWRWVLDRGVPRYGPDGEFAGYIGSCIDVTERRRAQEELRESRDLLEIILRGVSDGITAQDPSGRVIYANEAAARLCGYPSARALVEAPLEEVMSHFEISDAEGRPLVPERLPGRRVLLGERYAEEELRFRVLATGEERRAVVRATPVLDEEGRVRLAVNVFSDVTERRRAEQERARLAAIVESSEDAIIGKTLEGVITSWNRGAQRIYGYSPEEAVGRPITILAPPEREGEIAEILERVRRGERVERAETVRVTKDGRRIYISLTVSPVRDSAGNIVGAATIARDITERKRAEEQLKEIREAERRRIARDLHDGVLQDLSYAVQEIELLRLNAEGTGLEAALEAEADAIRNAVRGLRAAVHDLRLADELDRPLKRLLESLVERNREMARGQRIELDVKEGVPTGPLGEKGIELLRVLQEALTNARRHSGARNVVVSVGVSGGDLVAEVSDDGRGFAPGAAPGVGLRSMRERAAALGGDLEVYSGADGGTTVRLRFPMPETS